jgi:urease subunit alpha
MTCEPIKQRPRAGAVGKAGNANSAAFVSHAAAEADIGEAYGLEKEVLAVEGTREVGKADMRHNQYCPEEIEIDSETFAVEVDGERVSCEPSEQLPLASRYVL